MPARPLANVPLMISAAVAVDDHHQSVMLIILATSLFAVSFPGLSKRIPFLRIPHVVFFIGKHFGTGVILATAFIHLLDDAFRSLQSPEVKSRYHNIGKYTGLIILCSLLAIFLVEYLSTTYVDHLHAEPSEPPTRENTRPSSPEPGPSAPRCSSIRPSTETTPLLGTRPLLHHSHHPHNRLEHELQLSAPETLPIATVLANSPRILRLGREGFSGGGYLCECGTESEGVCPCTGTPDCRKSVDCVTPLGQETDSQSSREGKRKDLQPRVGRRRQIVGILVLQLGIMIHSLVIGLTLAVTSGSDFTSLTTAIIFHQLFEGLSLGIRIAALPQKNNKVDDEEAGSSKSSPTIRGAQPSSTTVSPQLVNIDDEEATKPQCRKPSPAKQSSRISQFAAWLRPHQNHHHHHQNHHGGSDSTLWEPESSSPEDTKEPTRGIDWLKLTLSLLFAITTPLGMGVGMIVWTRHNGSSQKNAQMLLTQGLMSAISAGLLIYAATVEMIAGDFVFGDVEGHGHHHHGGPNAKQNERGEGEGEGTVHHDHDEVEGHGDEYGHNGHGASSMGKKALAVMSLLAGVLGMVLVGLGE